MKKDMEAWRNIAYVMFAGFMDLLESMIICITFFIFFAMIGFVKDISFYIGILTKVAWAVTATSFGIRICKEIKNRIYTYSICALIAINVMTSVIMIVMIILS